MRILLGFGGNEESFDALETVVERAEAADDDLTIAILDNPSIEHDGETIEQKVWEVLDEFGLDAEIVHVADDHGERLVEIGDGGDFDRIVLGGSKRSPLGKITLGEVAEFVLLNAETSVTLVR